MYLLSVTTSYLAVFCPGQYLRSQELGVPQHRKCPGRQSPIPKAASRAGRAASRIPCSPRHGKGWTRAPRVPVRVGRRCCSAHISVGQMSGLQCQDAPADRLGSSTYSTALGSAGRKPMGRFGWNPQGGSGQLKPSGALKAPVSQSNYVICHCL